jgi:hypothetical protein
MYILGLPNDSCARQQRDELTLTGYRQWQVGRARSRLLYSVAGDTLGQSDYRFDREDERRGLARVTPLRSCCALPPSLAVKPPCHRQWHR